MSIRRRGRTVMTSRVERRQTQVENARMVSVIGAPKLTQVSKLKTALLPVVCGFKDMPPSCSLNGCNERRETNGNRGVFLSVPH